MATTQETTVDRIDVSGPFHVMSVRSEVVTYEDGIEVVRSFHRHVVAPNNDTTNEASSVKSLANELYTQEVKAAYSAHLATL